MICENATHNTFLFIQMLLLEGKKYLLQDSIPLPQSSERAHLIRKKGHWRKLMSVASFKLGPVETETGWLEEGKHQEASDEK